MLDYRFVWDARTDNGVQLGGHSAVLSTPAGQEALLHNVFEPVFRRYANHPAILSWEVMNEPEWTLQDAGTVDPKTITQPLTLVTFRNFARRVIGEVHSIAGSYATIGCANMKWVQNWGLGPRLLSDSFLRLDEPYSTDDLFATRAEALQLRPPGRGR